MNQKNNNKLSLSSIEAHDLLKELSKKKQSPVFTGTIQGNSMLPWIKDGDIIEIVPIPSKIHYGDIVAFYNKFHSKLVAHRVIGKKKGYILTKGDNCFKADSVIKKDELSGIVIKISRESSLKHFGLGNERYFIACFSCINLLQFFTKSITLILNVFKNE